MKKGVREGMTSSYALGTEEDVEGVKVKGGLGDSTYMQISSCENSDAGGRITSDKATGSQDQYQSNGKRVADDPGNVRGRNRRKKINGARGLGLIMIRQLTILIAIGYA